MLHDLIAIVEPDEDGSATVRSPGVGRWSAIPESGAWLGPGATIGVLTRLNARRRMRLPPGVAGRVAQVEPRRRIVSLAYEQPLFTLEPLGETRDVAAEETGPGAAGATAEGFVLRAPTDGVFYLRPAPDAPAFVEPGMRVRRGQPVGLVEVMKTFNQVLFDDPAFPEEAEVVEVRAGDSTEVSAGDVLMVLR